MRCACCSEHEATSSCRGRHQTCLLTDLMQAATVQAVQKAYRAKMSGTNRENQPDAGQIRSLGLLDRAEESKKA